MGLQNFNFLSNKMSLIESIFNLDSPVRISTNRNKSDVLRVNGVSGTDWSKSGTKAFEINNQQHYLNFSEAYFRADVELTLSAADKISLENNPFPRCFSRISINVGGTEVEAINQAVGEASTLANLVLASENYRRVYGQISGWIPDSGKGDTDIDGVDYNAGYFWRMKIYNEKKKFSFMFPLKYLFGFCDYEKVLKDIKIRVEMNLRPESEYNDDIFDRSDTASIASLKFLNVELCIPYIEPSLEIEAMLLKRLNTQKPIELIFLKRTMNIISIGAGANFKWSLGNYTNAIRFVLVCFKSSATPSVSDNNALFKAKGITSLRLQLNNMYYPINEMRFDIDNYDILEPYKAYIDACQVFGNDPCITAQEFRDLYPLFVFDTSSQPDSLKSNGIQLTLHIQKESTKTFEGFALLLEDAEYKIDCNSERMLRVS